MKENGLNIDSVFVDWKRYHQLDSSKYVITFSEFKYVNSENIDNVQVLVNDVVRIGDVLVKMINGDWFFIKKSQFIKSFERLN